MYKYAISQITMGQQKTDDIRLGLRRMEKAAGWVERWRNTDKKLENNIIILLRQVAGEWMALFSGTESSRLGGSPYAHSPYGHRGCQLSPTDPCVL